MTPFEIWTECRLNGITLTVDGDRLTWRGPKDAADRLLPVMRLNREALRACARELNGLPFEDGPFLPWGPYVAPCLLESMQRELFDVVDELAKLERWRNDDYDLVVGAIERQPISTLRPDLAHFRERLMRARAANKTRKHHGQY
ncbi:hypothetical protein [Burkholderia cepacia]|uniref:hypothetical protein n=1 Tax=Burkholderia cepacia TaxID=292 RepID=UPI0009C0C1D5|nr:hypothetical protein [Burkholderia cepacia]